MWKHAQPTPQLWSRMSLTLANCEHLGLLKLSGGQLRLKKVQPLLQQKHAETITRDRLFAIKHKSLKQSCVGLTSHSTAWPGLLEQEFIVPDCSMGVEAVDGNRPFHSCQVKYIYIYLKEKTYGLHECLISQGKRQLSCRRRPESESFFHLKTQEVSLVH